MTGEETRWFLSERSEALAGLLLTSRKDVHVLSERKNASGVDFLVEVNPGEADPSTKLFLVQVKGTMSSDKTDWMTEVKELYRAGASSISLPACVFVVNVRDNRSLYAWVAEPLVEDRGAKLRFLPPGEFHALDKAAVDEIVARVEAWYDALPKQFVPG
jgi:hypothetical protein